MKVVLVRVFAFVCFVVPTEDRLCFVLLCLQKTGFVLFYCA